MRSNGNIWNMSHCNRLVHERMETKSHERHIRALETTRGRVDHNSPPDQPHLRHKAKTRKLQEDRASEIQLENRILLQKMLNIDTKPSQLAAETTAQQRAAPRNLHVVRAQKEFSRITAENQELLKRLQSAKASINPARLEDEETDRQALKFRLSQNSCRGRAPKLRMPDVSGRLPRIGHSQESRLGDNDWVSLTNRELDEHLQEAERRLGSDNKGGGGGARASTEGEAPALET